MKPIEPGCLAIVTHAIDAECQQFVGTVVEVLYKDGYKTWHIQPNGGLPRVRYYAHEKHLMRIDDDGELTEITTEQEEELCTPH